MGYQSADDRTIATLRAENARLHEELSRVRTAAKELGAQNERLIVQVEHAMTDRAEALGTATAFRTWIGELFTNLTEHANEMKAYILSRASQMPSSVDPAIHEALVSGAEMVLEADARLYTRLQQSVHKVGK